MSFDPALLPTDFDPSLLSESWSIVHGSDAAGQLEDELARELSDSHRLSQVEAQAVAVRRLLKEAIYYLPGEQRWAVVHLTGVPESTPHLPSTTVVGTWAAVIEEFRGRGRP